MFKKPNSTKKNPKLIKSRYGVPEKVKYVEGDLWDVPTAEYKAWNVPQIIFNVLRLEGELTYSSLKDIISREGVPTHTGYIWMGLYNLKKAGLVEINRNPPSEVKLKILDNDGK